MKFVFIAGGFVGFIFTSTASWWAGHEADRVLFDGTVGCLAGALLFRWFWTVLVHGIRETLITRHAAQAAAAAAQNASKTK